LFDLYYKEYNTDEDLTIQQRQHKMLKKFKKNKRRRWSLKYLIISISKGPKWSLQYMKVVNDSREEEKVIYQWQDLEQALTIQNTNHYKKV
jgi:hypothetical protein